MSLKERLKLEELEGEALLSKVRLPVKEEESYESDEISADEENLDLIN